MRAITPASIAFTLIIVASACNNETIVLATVPVEDAGMGNKRVLVKCLTNTDCSEPKDDYCQINNDHDVPIGHCSPRPLFCNDQAFEPVCAPSGISYFSDCFRKQAGEPTSAKGECIDTARDCDLANKCPTGAVCALVDSEADDPHGPTCGRAFGRCWGINACQPDKPGPSYNECVVGPGTDALRCVDICTAVQTGRPFTQARPEDHCMP